MFATGLSKERNVDERKKILDGWWTRLHSHPVIEATITLICLSQEAIYIAREIVESSEADIALYTRTTSL